MEHFVQDKVVIITGGSSGFGLEAARMLLEMGAKVAITARNRERLDRAAHTLAHENLLVLQADATKTADWKKVIASVLEKFGRLDVLVNNHGAGIKIAEVENLEDDEIQEVLDVNLSSVIKGCREVIRVMKKQGSGLIVNVSSGCAYHSWASWAVYTAAKDGMVGFTRCLHREMSAWGGRASSFIPGAARTNFCRAAGISEDFVAGYPEAADFARTLVHCIDVPDHCFIEEVNIWGTKQIKEMLDPF